MKVLILVIVAILLVGVIIYPFVKPQKNSSTEIKGFDQQNNSQEDVLTRINNYSLSEVQTHNSKDSCWTTVEGKIYNITPFVSNHPGGERNIMKVCGIDGSEIFGDKHGNNNQAKETLKEYYIGELE